VTAGRAAGAKVVGVATTHTHKELAETDYIIDDFTDLDPAQLISILFKKPD
jgi:beta-phosphoglucomutase-like phosphatase (HAD superfamily)